MPRPSRYVDGLVAGRLTTLKRLGPTFCVCRCSCGTEKMVRVTHVMSGRTRSCGCLHREVVSVASAKAHTKHGMYGTPFYAVWNSMRDRCTNPNSHAYKDYGGRGIGLCERWRKFENFYADMWPRPAGLTLERENNELGYTPENCLWATRKAQGNNRRSNVLLMHADQTMSVSQWAEHLKVDRGVLFDRLRSGWSVEKTLTTPKRGNK